MTLLAACASDAPNATTPEAAPTTAVTNADPAGHTGLHKVKHVIILVQSDHSFDNYFGALAYAPGSPYHPARTAACRPNDHTCVDGLDCTVDASGGYACNNSNPHKNGTLFAAFHTANRCVDPDLKHGWGSGHHEVNFAMPNGTAASAPMTGFVQVNEGLGEVGEGVVSPAVDIDNTMGFYNQDDLPFYYDLAQGFAISDRYFSSVIGPEFPNRAYLLAGTSFGHLVTADRFGPEDGYRPFNGTIFDLLDASHVSWANYFQDVPQGASFRPFGADEMDPHFMPLPMFLAQAAGTPGLPELPAVSFVDPNFGLMGNGQNDEHAPTDIQRGQAFVSQVIGAVRNGPLWQDSVIFVAYDTHGGVYDHVAPPVAAEPDAVRPGLCADLSSPPSSLRPGGGAECSENELGAQSSVAEAGELCADFKTAPSGTYPSTCAKFDQLGIRVPFMAISPFAKPHYVSHEVSDHTSILAFLEKRFLPEGAYLTQRDKAANNLLDMFDFERSPSLRATVGHAALPTVDCSHDTGGGGGGGDDDGDGDHAVHTAQR